VRALALLSLLIACTGSSTTASGPPTASGAGSQPVRRPAASAEPAPAASTTATSTDPVQAAMTAPDRPQADKDKDADRKPRETLELLELEPGDTAADLMGGRGYSTELLARTVGPTGTVYVQNNRFVLDKFAEGPLSERLARLDGYDIRRLDRELDDPGLPEASLDAAFLGLFYHDSVWMEIDRAKMNQAVFDALKPGGVYVVTDHFAQDGSGTRDVKTLHRIDHDLVLQELQAAGFVLEGEATHLRNADDDRTLNVFDEQIRGKTDRFVLKLRKPAE